MTAPMMRARLNGGPCRIPGHGCRCERVDDRQPITRAREKRAWQREVRAAQRKQQVLREVSQ